ncbi:ANTAR domain-containing protein [Cellulomonas sp. NPDC057328]|uniref:ANTAR domain-containing protein n=1 Tax=Cellulomonas sp. NPDC057328 TaxID=3346101 RepID=UPI003644ADD9
MSDRTTAGRDGWASPDLEALAELLSRVDPASDGHALDALHQELETAHEELHVADAELRAQRQQLEDLLDARSGAGARREWLTSLLPVPVIETDRAGVVRSANTAAARALNIALAHLLRKPLVGFVDDAGRPRLRRVVSSVGTEPTRLRLHLRPRRAEPVAYDVVVVADAGDGDTVTWTLLPASDPDTPAAQHDTLRVARAFVALSWLTASDLTQQQRLAHMARIVAEALPAASAVSVNVGPPDRPHALASSAPLAAAADGRQVHTGEGPCVDAFAAGESVVSADVTTDARWPAFARSIAGEQVRSALAVPVQAEGSTHGCVNCYGTAVDAFGEADIRTAELLATAAGAVFAAVREQERLRDLGDQLTQALTSRAVIDQAKGVVMAVRGGTAAEAFAYMAAISQRQNVKLRAIAEQIVAQAAAGEVTLPGR